MCLLSKSNTIIMIYTYTITGMTCDGCRVLVEEKLNALEHVLSTSVNLEESEATVSMSQHISTKVLKEALPNKYVVSKKKHATIFQTSSSTTKTAESYLKQLFPLFLIFTFIIGAAALLNYKPWNFTNFMLDFMGLFYVVFSFFKFLDLKGFAKSFKMYDPLAKVVPVYGWVYPFIELALGIMFLMRIRIPTALIITLVILGITTLGVIKTLINKKSIQCACLGTVLKLPMTKATFIENTVMIIMASIMLLNGHN